MPRVITTLQAMSHPTVVETINCLSEMSQRLQDENDALRAALAQPEQEPVAWMVYTLDGLSVCVTDSPADFTEEHKALPLYTTPPQRPWVGLTGDEISSCDPYEEIWDLFEIARKLEAKLKEKNNG